MKKSRFTEPQIVSILRQADAGVPVRDICRQAGISVPTYYQWKSKYGDMEASDLKRVKESPPVPWCRVSVAGDLSSGGFGVLGRR